MSISSDSIKKSYKVNVHLAKTTLSKLLNKAEQGEETIITRSGKPIAKLVPYKGQESQKEPRKFGQWKGKVWFSEDYDQADTEIQKAFEDSIKKIDKDVL